MDAVEYLKQLKRMCKGKKCNECPLYKKINAFRPCVPYAIEDEKMNVEIVEKWAKEHPVKTRQSKLLKLFPNAKMENGILTIFPCVIDPSSSERRIIGKCDGKDCWQCRKEYWLEEIE